MPKSYLVVAYRAIKHQEKWSAYAKLAVPAIQKAGGRFIVRGMPAKTYGRRCGRSATAPGATCASAKASPSYRSRSFTSFA
jgi:uncharacterized protein (DUF1330 family)